ncbi:lipoyl synthase [Gammaproteobacteria bacterium]|nr:lipoyl synthase [Gammaproteobacteria bacterium]
MSDLLTEKKRGEQKFKRARIPIQALENDPQLKKPSWIKTTLDPRKIEQVKQLRAKIKSNDLHTVCQEASCPNLYECYSHGTASFMILGDICTRRCAFCDVAHGRPNQPDPNEPANLAQTVANMQLKYVVITSVDRDDLPDGGAAHFSKCITAIRMKSPNTQIEILVPDFRKRQEQALNILTENPADVFNHNVETSPKLYHFARIGANYQASLDLLQSHKNRLPHIRTKSGLMVGLGETDDDVIEVLHDLKAHQVDMITIGQYLQPSKHHLPVRRFVHPDIFAFYKEEALKLGFAHVASGPMVRSSYHADLQAKGEVVE